MRGASTALAIKILSAGILYGSQVLLARWLGTTAYGIYDYVNAVGVFLAFIAGLGLPIVVLRLSSEYITRQDWSRLNGIILGGWQQTLIVSLVISGCGTVVLWQLYVADYLDTYAMPLMVGIWAVPIVALMNLQTEIVRAFQKMVLAYAPAQILQPLLLVWDGLCLATAADDNQYGCDRAFLSLSSVWYSHSNGHYFSAT